MIIYITIPIFLQLSTEFDSSLLPQCNFEEYQAIIVYWTDLINVTLISLPISNVLTIMTCYYVYESRNRFSIRSSKAKLRDRKFTINAIAINLLNFCCVTPLMATLILSHYLRYDSDTFKSTLLISVSNFVFAIYSSSSFLVNIVVNSIFCKQFYQMIGLKKSQSSSGRYIQSRINLQSNSETN